ncbi:DUF4132 domain-containing protein [Nocardia sp. NPDC051030]|uniref:DUF4132 domain-containing protein n=1 Tax=Nocardia sp. NPDC051030 TaxID=3155162 RepID=UPI003412D5FA
MTMAETRPAAGEGSAELIAEEIVRDAGTAEAPRAAPEILRNPPWQRKNRRKPVVISGLVAPSEVRCSWRPGEREEALRLLDASYYADFEQILTRIDPDHLSSYELGALVVAGRDRALPILRTGRLRWVSLDSYSLRAAIAAFELDAYPLLLGAVREFPREVQQALNPYESTELVDIVIGRLDRRTLRPAALRYLRRHSRYVAQVLIPRAVGTAAKLRRVAIRVLRLLDEQGHGEEIRGVATEYGEPVAAAVQALLTADPVALLPNRIPDVPAWVDRATLPPVHSADGQILPDAAVENLLIMLVLAETNEPYAGVAQVLRECDPATLAELAWELYRQWLRAGGPARHSWVYEALGSFGNDDTVAALLEHVRINRSDARSVTVLDAFVAIGSDAALLALKFISEKVKTPRVRDGAKQRIEAVAERLGLTADQLADRLVPDLGLRADGTAVLDFGARQFVVGFDEVLRPTITAADGAPVKTLPKPGVRDDAELAEAAHKTFRKLKKDVKAIAVDQIRRLERAMVDQRRFTAGELRTLFIDHPLRRHVTRRLVWGVYDGDTLTGTFRIAEDLTFADSRDDGVEVADDAVLGVAHPIQFACEVAAWGEVFSDYELLQPFPQVERETFAVPDALRTAEGVPDDGTTVDSTRFLGLPGRNWLPIENTDGAHIMTFEKPLPGGRFLQVNAFPGLMAYDPRAYPEQTFDARLGSGRHRPHGVTFADLDAITASEVLRDIAWLKAGAL